MPHRTLIDVPTLQAHLADPAWRIVDCRFDLADPQSGERAYRESHVPGAIYVHLDRELSDHSPTGLNRGRHPLPPRETVRAHFEALGIGDGTQVAAYDATGGMFAARLWWMLRWIGHEAVAVLDGGWSAWQVGGSPVSSEPGTPRAASLSLREPLTRLVDVSQVEAASTRGDPRIIDARAADRFAGLNETIDPVAGHIPGAANRFFKRNLGEDGRFKDAAVLRAEIEALGAGPRIHQCGSGVTACHNVLAARHAGLGEDALYAGSWSEWITDPSRPVAR